VGEQIALTPAGTKNMVVNFSSSHEIDDICLIFDQEYCDLEANLSLGDDYNYSMAIPLEFFTEPGIYNLEFRSVSQNLNVLDNRSAEVLSMLGFTIDLKEVNCNVENGGRCLIDGDRNISTAQNPTIRNIGNKELDFKLYADDLDGGESIINASSIKFSFDGSPPNFDLSNIPTTYDVNLGPGSNAVTPLSLLIEVPVNAQSGDYNTKMIFIGVSDD
jgi:hypothetical protein